MKAQIYYNSDPQIVMVSDGSRFWIDGDQSGLAGDIMALMRDKSASPFPVMYEVKKFMESWSPVEYWLRSCSFCFAGGRMLSFSEKNLDKAYKESGVKRRQTRK